jgi:hypothetical protein
MQALPGSNALQRICRQADRMSAKERNGQFAD